jgi:hypothetical protein
MYDMNGTTPKGRVTAYHLDDRAAGTAQSVAELFSRHL